MTEIKNLIFDLGGVLLNIDYNRTKHAFKELGYTDFGNMYSMLKGNNVFDNLETGHISEDEFYQYMTAAANGNITNRQVQDAWNAMLLDFRAESLQHLKKLRKDYRIFLLSNTNAIHKKAFDRTLNEQTGVAGLENYFDKAYFSQQVGLRKPDAGIFEFVLQDAGILAAESLFIDDLLPNIETAARLGFKTHLLLPEERIENLMYY